MEGRLLARARARQEQIRSDNKAEADRRRREIHEKYPAAAELDAKIRALMTELVGTQLGRPGRTPEELAEVSLALQAERAALLRRNGYREDYLDPIYSCPLCHDTGWHEGRICDCITRLYKQEQTRELAPLLRRGDETFDTFRLDWYPDTAEGRSSPREQMRRVFSVCRTWADTFGEDSPNLLFTGAPGLGKTFLSAAIARVVAEAGFGVAYDTVTGTLAAFEKEKFSQDPDEKADAASRVRQLLGCDLLILDDLGTEMTTAFTQSALYSLLDGRLRAGKKTIVSTNLDRDGIAERYGAALASRLGGEYAWLEFRGRDIRAMRKERG